MKKLGYKQVEVRVMKIEDAEHKLNLEITKTKTEKTLISQKESSMQGSLKGLRESRRNKDKLHQQVEQTHSLRKIFRKVKMLKHET